jgi:sec-independent protein translocase protein TatA
MHGMFAFLGLGGTELMVVFGAALLLFGPKKLPELARGLGKGIREFKKASNEVTEELERTMEEKETTTKFPPEGSPPDHSVSHALHEPAASAVPESQNHSAEHSEPPK